MPLVASAAVVFEHVRRVEDESLAARHFMSSLLITAPATDQVERIARRVHGASVRATFPFVRVSPGAFPVDAATLQSTCTSLLKRAAGGSLFLMNVEDTPLLIQDLLIDLLSEPRRLGNRPVGVRLVAGTTVSLCERIAARTFSERMFYRLNIIHLTVEDRFRVGEPAAFMSAAAVR